MNRIGLLQAGVVALALCLTVRGPVEAANAEVIKAAPRSTGAVALTFDDGWNTKACRMIADTLRDYGAVGTFFINGRELQGRPAAWRAILEGMPVGNHTLGHKNLTRKPGDVIRRQIRKNERVHEQVLGRPMLKLFRPPYGAHDARVRRIAGELGYRYTVMWNVQPHDWTVKTRASTVVDRATGARPGSIILLHCRYHTTVKALPKIIRHYQGRGIDLVGLDELLRP